MHGGGMTAGNRAERVIDHMQIVSGGMHRGNQETGNRGDLIDNDGQ